MQKAAKRKHSPFKKGQASGAAGLIGLILFFILMYILFLPPGERADLLSDSDSGSGGGHGSRSNRTLFSENVGRVDYLRARNFEKTIPNVYLEERRDAAVLKKFNPIYIKNGVFDKKERELIFTLDQLENIENVQLVFAAKIRKGILTLQFNGETIFESGVGTFNVPPITVDKSLLERENTIRLSVSSVGWKFWRTNEYNLEDIKVIGNIIDTSGKESQALFTLTGTEFFNLEEATLRFVPYCGRQDVGKLDVFINNKNVYSSIPVCDDPYSITLPPNIMSSGANRIKFTTQRGSFSVEQVRVLGKLKDSKTITRFFEVEDDDYD
ncbi:MAG: hypothetical protein QF632_04370, partial [Candidatus Woesearchaeota archaeon]|nr:hypothetical protein [Candidatus Woesearchaeota archaeon]